MSNEEVAYLKPSLKTFVVRVRCTQSAVRPWVITAILFLTPLTAYWPTIFHYYSLRDGYSNLREAHEEPGKILQFCASHARPIYGRLLEASFGTINTVRDLQWLRLLSTLLLGTLAWLTFYGLCSLGWSTNKSLTFALWITLVPSAQVIAGWCIGWPYVIAAILAFGAFFVADHAIAADRNKKGAEFVWGFAATGLLGMSALIYQPSALFYTVPFAAALIERRNTSAKASVRLVGIHLLIVIGALGLAYVTMSVFFAAGFFVKSSRIAFEHDWWSKTTWFLNAPLPNALSVFVINDDNQHDHTAYLTCAGFVGLILVLGVVAEWHHYGRTRGLIWFAGLLGLPVFAFLVNLVAAERYATYRTIFSVTGVLLCYLIASVRPLTGRLGGHARKAIAIVVIAVAFFTARHRAYSLIAIPQGNEWRLILEGAKQAQLGETRSQIFVIEPTPADISTATIYHDEFGSLSSNSDWVPKEMFKRAMHELHPVESNLDQRYEFSSGQKLPTGKRFSVVINMQHLRDFYTDN